MENNLPVYLDYNATTPIDPEAAEEMRPFLDTYFGNPSSSHVYGRKTAEAMALARKRVAGLLGCDPGCVIFTSGGSEANNLAIKGTAFALREKGNHIITSCVEHPAVTEVCRYLEGEGFAVTYLPADGEGRVSVEEFEAAITRDTILASIMHANNEVGTVQPVRELAEAAHRHGVVFHTDAAQAAGKISVRIDALGVDLLSLAGHKFYAPKGVGALYAAPGVRLEKLIHGASHESGMRAGTENVLEIAGLGKAAEVAARDLVDNRRKMSVMRDLLQAGLEKEIPGLQVFGAPDNRLPNTLSVSIPGAKADRFLETIESEVAASAGAACHSDSVEVSHVLKAMGIPEKYAMGTIRLSTGKMTGPEDIDRALEAIISAAKPAEPV